MVAPRDYFKDKLARREAHARRGLFYQRERISLGMITALAQPGRALLDIGCAEGKFLARLRETVPGLRLAGVDYSPVLVEAARARGLDVSTGNVEEGLDHPDGAFDLVYCAEVIEHCYDPDRLVMEIRRVLKPGGHAVVTTPNLCVWYNRILMLLGQQPGFVEMSTHSKLVGAGWRSLYGSEALPVGHVRIFTLRALKDLLSLHGLRPLRARGAVFDEGFARVLCWIDRCFTWRPGLASQLVVLAEAPAQP